MKGQVVLETLKDSKALSKAHKQIFNAFAEDNKRMEERMENLEKKMDTVLLEQSAMKATLDVQSQRIDYLIKIFEEKKEEKKEKILIAKEIFISLVSKTGFWIVLILLIALVFNITIADLGAFIKATI